MLTTIITINIFINFFLSVMLSKLFVIIVAKTNMGMCMMWCALQKILWQVLFRSAISLTQHTDFIATVYSQLHWDVLQSVPSLPVLRLVFPQSSPTPMVYDSSSCAEVSLHLSDGSFSTINYCQQVLLIKIMSWIFTFMVSLFPIKILLKEC